MFLDYHWSTISQALNCNRLGGSNQRRLDVDEFFLESIFGYRPKTSVRLDIKARVEIGLFIGAAVEEVAKGLDLFDIRQSGIS